MARQKGPIKYIGTLGDIRHFKIKNTDGYFAGMIGGPTAEQIKTDPAFARTRENMSEFGGSANVAKAVRIAFAELVKSVADSRLTGRLTALMKKINKEDTTGIRGQRPILVSQYPEHLKNAEFNKNTTFGSVMFAPFTITPNVDRNSSDLVISPFKPKNSINIPIGATHFRIVNAIGVISDYIFDTETKMHQQVNEAIKAVLAEIMTPPNALDFSQRLEDAKKPVKLLFVGPNGAGKTTTIAKIATMLKKKGMTVCLAATDTFRAAAIEQLSVHAQRLNVPIIKSEYGSDPASVAFDAVKYAKAHDIDAVLIDSAGRQDTNANLIDEMKKIDRVVAPDLKIYVGESISGSALIEQIRAFHEAIGIDGAILTKLDCDAKGGTAISLSYTTGVPILFLGVGQQYEDLRAFDSDEVAGQILS